MATVSDEREETPFQDTTIVDVDVHTSTVRHPDVAEKFVQYLDEPYASQIDPETAGGESSAYPRTGHPISIPGKLDAEQHSVTDPERDVNQPWCEEFGIDYAILNIVHRIDMVANTRRIPQEMRAINNVMIESFLDDHDHIYGLGVVATRDPADTAEEIDRLGNEDKIVGLGLHPGGQDRALGDPRYDPIYEAAEDNDLPITFHGSGSGLQWEMSPLAKGLNNYMQMHALTHPWSMMWAMTSLVTEGVPVKFPDLDFVVLESGVGWIPHMMYRLNREYKQRRSRAPLLEKSPEEYVRDSFYFATQPLEEPNDSADLVDLLELVGADSLMFSSDYPHFDFDNPSSVVDYFQGFDEDEREQIFHGNAADVYDIPV